MKLSLGLDIGIASTGLALVQDDYHVLEAISYIYPAAEASKNVERRGYRQEKRGKRRLRTRISDFGKLWVKYGFRIPEEQTNIPLQMRVEGLKNEISMDDIYWVLLNNLKHRGISYLEDADLDGTGGSDYAKSLELNQRELAKKYPCEIQLERLEKYGCYRGENTVFDGKEKITISNVFTISAYRKEVSDFLNKQKEFHKEISDGFISDFIEIFNRKREYYVGPGNEKSRTDYGRFTTKKDENGEYITDENIFEKLIGRCSVYKDEQRAAGATYTAQEFNILNDLNNLTINGRKLEREEKEKIVSLVKESSSVNMRKIIKAVIGEDIISLEGARIDKNEKEQYHSFETYRKLKKALAEVGFDINDLDIELLDNIGNILTINTEKDSILSGLEREGINLGDKFTDCIVAFRKSNGYLFTKWQSLSLRIMQELIPELYNQPKNQMALLSDMGLLKTSNERFKGLRYVPTDVVIEEIYNPVVRRSIKVTINALNAILKKYGHLDQIVIEMPRDRNSDEEKKRIDDENKSNKKELDDIIQKIKNEYGISITDSTFRNHKKLVLKLKLWNEQQGRCLYSGKSIDINDLINNPDLFEIDHALPISISFDDARTNKVLVYRTENQNKGNETPLMYLSRKQNTSGWGANEYKSYVRSLKLKRAKEEKLLFRKDISKIEVLQGFIQRNINDTSYASRVVLNILQSFFDSNGIDTKVKVVRGAFTHQMRVNLKLDKNREESYAHHAVDAMLIAYSQMGYDAYHKLQGSVIDFETGEILDSDRINDVLNEETYKKFLYEDKWLDIRKNLLAADHMVKYWYMVDRKCNRQLCDRTIYGTRERDGKVYQISKTKSIYTKQGLEALAKRLNKPECFLMYRNDPQTWNDLMLIYNKYKRAGNPFVEYEKETGDYLRKHSKNHNGPRIECLKYEDGEVGSCIDISHKYGFAKGSKRVIQGSLKPYRMDVYYNSNSKDYLLVGIRQSDVCMRGGKHVIDEDAYSKILINEKVISEGQNRLSLIELGYEFKMSFYRDEIIQFEKNGIVRTERFLSRTMPNVRNYIEVKPINKSNFDNRSEGVIGLSKTTSIKKIRVDILGNRYLCEKEEFKIEC